ncbi:hypothetical protein E2562_017270 [Oryza meyeriana var. granulata]|uniref:Uncharacterized protein n=1 Tax=Oryza meyeriana var. granulata TaxID=110450 RepID=A0A6G1ELW7_9ORYZ|nr:hypothetical protein E2562_017270 [Oryza meyeriana var. granulata]
MVKYTEGTAIYTCPSCRFLAKRPKRSDWAAGKEGRRRLEQEGGGAAGDKSKGVRAIPDRSKGTTELFTATPALASRRRPLLHATEPVIIRRAYRLLRAATKLHAPRSAAAMAA